MLHACTDPRKKAVQDLLSWILTEMFDLLKESAVDERNPAPPEMYKTLSKMVGSPYQLVSRISEPSTVWSVHP